MTEAEVSKGIGADKYEQSQERTSHRCGFRPRRLDTRLGTMYLMIPKASNGGYIPFFVTQRKRCEEALIYLMEYTEDWSVTRSHLSEGSLQSINDRAA